MQFLLDLIPFFCLIEFDDTSNNNFENSNFRTKRKSKEEDFSTKIKRIISDVSSKLNNSKPESTDDKKNEKSNLRTKKKSKKNDLPDYTEDAELFGWLKKKRRRKKNKKIKKKKKGKYYRDKSEPEVEDNENESFNDFDNIKFHVTPEQEEDINSFMKGSNSPPERFQFDVDKFIAKKSTFDKHSLLSTEEEPNSQKQFYEFEYPAVQPDEIDSAKKTSKRDVMTQRLKAIANKINSNSFEEIKLKQRDTELPYDDDDENSSNDVISTSTQKIDESYDFVDKFYLLNDGNTKLEEKEVKNVPLIDPLDVNIDLELNEKFKELKLDKSFYSDLRDKKNEKSESLLL